MMRNTLGRAAGIGLAILCAGCFGILSGGGGKHSASVLVTNDLYPAASVTVELKQDGSDKAGLGTVAAGETRTLTYSSDDLSGSYQLVATQSSGASVASRNFSLFDRARVQWELRSNNLSVIQGQ